MHTDHNILFVAAFEITPPTIVLAPIRMKLPSGQRLPPVRGYMDDITTVLETAACTTRLLKRIDELVGWARMKIKPAKSRSLSIRKGVRSDRTIFVAGGEEIPLLADQPVRSLGRTYTADLSDRQMGETVRKQLADGLARINQSQLPGKYKVWSYQFLLYQGWCGRWSWARSPHRWQTRWTGWQLVHQEVVGTAEMPVRSRPLQQEHTATATAIHWPGIQAREGSDGAGAEGIHRPTGESSWHPDMNREEVESPGRGWQGDQQTETPWGSRQSPGGVSRPREERNTPPLLVKGFQRRAASHGGGRSHKDWTGAPQHLSGVPELAGRLVVMGRCRRQAHVMVWPVENSPSQAQLPD